MAGLNYFGLCRRVYSISRLSDLSGLSENDIRHALTTGEIGKNDHNKFKKIWRY